MRNKRNLNVWLAAAAVLALTSNAHATKFTNQFIEFDLPAKWKCQLEGAEWVCQSEDASKKKEAIIVLAAKLKGDQDSLEKYEEYLKKPRNFTASAKAVISEPKWTSQKTLNGHVWIDSMHMQSEVPNFFTRYLATVKEDIGVLVTYSIDKTKFSAYEKEFDAMAQSLKVFRNKKTAVAAANSNLFDNARPGLNANLTPSLNPDSGAPVPQSQAGGPRPSGGGSAMGLILLLAAAGGGFFIWKKKKQGGG